MINPSTILGAAFGTLFLAKGNAKAVQFQPITRFPGQSDLLTWCGDMGVGTSVLLLVAGIVYLLFGWKWFKPLVTLNAAFIGGYVGALVGHKYGGAFVGGAFGSIISASLTIWLMQWAVAVMGGIVGAVLGASVWRAVGLDVQFAWAGAMTGLVGFGMFSFILFRGSIIMYTSLQGAMMLVVGLLGLIFKYQGMSGAVTQGLNAYHFALPAAVFVPAIVGLMYQQFWGAGGGGGGGAPASAGDKKK